MTFHKGLFEGPLVRPDIGAVNGAIEKIRAHVSSLAEALASEAKNLRFGRRQLIRSNRGELQRRRGKTMSLERFNKILVVDDTTASLQLVMNLLSKKGYTVYPVSDGELALEFLQSTLPDLILLDIKMPGMDGYEVCRRLKADERLASIPVIFLSVLEDEQ